jgi:hypothetical protein
MVFKNSNRNRARSVYDLRRRNERLGRGRTSSIESDPVRIARAFYCDVLQGRQVWDSERAGGLSFIVAGTRIDVSTSAAHDREPVVLSVGNPDAVAERCWDSGFNVRVGHDSADDATVSVIDPFGRQIDLVP